MVELKTYCQLCTLLTFLNGLCYYKGIQISMTQSARAAEYTDCISVEG